MHEEELNKQESKQVMDTCSVLHTKDTDSDTFDSL